MKTHALQFAAPQWLWFTALALALVGALFWVSAKARRRQLEKFADPSVRIAPSGTLKTHGKGRFPLNETAPLEADIRKRTAQKRLLAKRPRINRAIKKTAFTVLERGVHNEQNHPA